MLVFYRFLDDEVSLYKIIKYLKRKDSFLMYQFVDTIFKTDSRGSDQSIQGLLDSQ